jgi:hypothetical protein
VPEQEGGDVLPLAPVVLDGQGPCAHQVSHCLVRLIRNPDRGQLARPQQAGQGLRITPVRLHPIARPAWDQRGRDHGARVPQGEHLSIQTVAGRACFVADVQRLIPVSELADQLGHAVRRVVEFAKITDLAIPATLCHRHRIPGFGGIDPDERLTMSLHGSSPMR